MEGSAFVKDGKEKVDSPPLPIGGAVPKVEVQDSAEVLKRLEAKIEGLKTKTEKPSEKEWMIPEGSITPTTYFKQFTLTYYG